MKWFERLERKYSRYAIPNLMYYIIVLYIVGLVINLFAPAVYTQYLALDVKMILHGQIWRIFTFIIQPPNSNIIFMAFALYFYYMIGSVLERIWGSFRFNLYFFTGVLLQVVAAFLVYFIFGYNFSMSTYYINLALFMAFAMEQPDMEVLLFFVLPIKIKWLAWLDGLIFAVTIIGGYASGMIPFDVWMRFAANGIVFDKAIATSALVSMINFILFAVLYSKGPAKTQTQRNYQKAIKSAKKAQKKREQGQRQSFNERFYNANSEKSTWESANKPYVRPNTGGTKHRCAVCGRTELDGEDLIFRYCSKCEGGLEYCQDHLYTHIHVTGKKNASENVVNINK